MDPYKILGVSKTATQDEIKSAYRKLAKKLHPDLNPGNKKTEEQFKEVNKAYDAVGTPEARVKFDRGETDEQQQQAYREQNQRRRNQGPFYYETQEPGARYSESAEGFDPDIFASFFGGGSMGGQGFGQRSRRTAGEDQHYSMSVDFTTSVLGAENEITLPTGKKLKVKIPPGIKSGMKLRLKGQAEGGRDSTSRHDGTPGDLYIEINVLPSDKFKRVDDDLEMELPLSLTEAVLGGEVRVQTIDGAIMLKIPANVSSGSRIRIRGKGVPKSGGQRGDLFAIVKIVMPPKADPELATLMKTWSEKHHYDPRSEAK